MNRHTEEEVIALLRSENQQKNDQGLKELYRLFFPMISQMIRQNSGTTEDVEDLFQDGILVVFNQIKKDNLVLTCKLRTYFYSICRNLWLKQLNQRKVKIVDLTDQESFIPVDASIFHSIAVREEQKAMLELINQLGPDCQKMLRFFYYDRLRMKEIALRMNFANEQVARNKKVKCLKKLIGIVDNATFFKRFFKT